MGNEFIVKKHLGTIKFEEFTLKLGLGMEPSLVTWMQDSLSRASSRRSGTIAECDLNNAPILQREFQDALISEISFPTMDATSREAGFITLKFSPESVRRVAAREKCFLSKPKPWITANFKVELEGLDTTRVSKIDSFGIKIKIRSASGRVGGQESASPEFSNLRLTIGNTSLKGWQEWHDSFLIQGNSDERNEKAGFIIILAPDLKEIARIKLDNVGMIKMSSTTGIANDRGAQTVVDLYVEKMEFIPGK
ncbi:MAG: hypothetical protein A2X86_06325 [Bdellovibrionales bacterium GWA2_49_15]|nr:MAG: hypothetical protein A2X86_06325 [Bdellovibrionales bacterium GWA2_49_15]